MREYEVSLNPNKLVKYLRKPSKEFTRHDIIRFIEENGIEMVNFRFAGEDGKLKTLNFVITSRDYLESILSTGERVDGSSLFSYVDADSSDLYVIPRFSSAFVNPFSEIPSIDILCSYYTKDGKPLESAPEYILRKAHNEFKKSTGFVFKAMGELEYYVISKTDTLYPAKDQKGYADSQPFSKWENLRREAMNLIAQAGGKIKYGHSEVGNFTSGDEYYEQQEIEFQPVEAEDAVDQLLIGKWILRMLGKKHNVNISFAPKITVGKAGSGLHIHFLAEKNGVNLMADDEGITDTAKKMIAGILSKAKELTAFGNTVPLSYLRLVPHQEAPVNICWGDTNRSALMRVPLGWIAKTNMVRDANPFEKYEVPYIPGKQTVELRTPDGSADLYHLMAGLIMAAQSGLEKTDSLELSKKLYSGVNIFKEENRETAFKFEQLPVSCSDSADALEKDRSFFEKNKVFPKGTIDRFIDNLRSFKDKNLREELFGKDDEIKKLVKKYMHNM
ncbi:MAG: glutamine synthetase family protein [Ignavibacteria bacterium]|nr:glutamine synthetase [Ignavibacteria bacterium]MBK9405548.1 glutamine synthetase [Ignavibacteria bacterium]